MAVWGESLPTYCSMARLSATTMALDMRRPWCMHAEAVRCEGRGAVRRGVAVLARESAAVLEVLVRVVRKAAVRVGEEEDGVSAAP